MLNQKINKTMVKIVKFRTYQNEGEKPFHVLVVQSGLESVKSKETGKTYFTTRKANVPCTFNERTCQELIGSEVPGVIKKVKVEPYDYTVEGTGEVIKLTHRYEFMSEEESVVKENVLETEEVF